MKLIKIIIYLSLAIFVIGFIYVLWEDHQFNKVYSSYENKKLAKQIEKTLERKAEIVRDTRQSQHIKVNELIEHGKIEKICIIGPYSPNIDEFIGFEWKQAHKWKLNVINDDTLFSIFLIENNNVIPIKIDLSAIRLEKQTCIKNDGNIIFDLYYKGQKVFLSIRHANERDN